MVTIASQSSVQPLLGLHGVGVELQSGQSVDEWAQAAGLGWAVEKRALRYPTAEGRLRKIPRRHSLIRTDTEEVLDIVSRNYQPVQPAEVLSLFRRVVDSTSFKMRAAGVLRGGRRIFALAECDEGNLVLPGGDRVARCLLLATSYDRTTPTVIQQMSLRLVCTNQLPSILSDKGRLASGRLTFRHVTVFDQKAALDAMALDEQWSQFGSLLRRMAETRVPDEATLRRFFIEAMYAPAQLQSGRVTRTAAARRADQLLTVMRTSPGHNLQSADNTVWGALNAVTYYVDHSAGRRSRDPSLRLDRNWFADGLRVKRRALQLAAAMVASN